MHAKNSELALPPAADFDYKGLSDWHRDIESLRKLSALLEDAAKRKVQMYRTHNDAALFDETLTHTGQQALKNAQNLVSQAQSSSRAWSPKRVYPVQYRDEGKRHKAKVEHRPKSEKETSAPGIVTEKGNDKKYPQNDLI